MSTIVRDSTYAANGGTSRLGHPGDPRLRCTARPVLPSPRRPAHDED